MQKLFVIFSFLAKTLYDNSKSFAVFFCLTTMWQQLYSILYTIEVIKSKLLVWFKVVKLKKNILIKNFLRMTNKKVSSNFIHVFV